MSVIRALRLAGTLLSSVDHPIFGNGTWRHQCKVSKLSRSLSQTGEPTLNRGTTTSSTGSRRPFQLSQDLRRAIYCPARPILAFWQSHTVSRS